MRERIYRIAAVLCYIAVLAYLNGFSLGAMLDVRGIGAVLLGTLLFSLPVLYEYRRAHKDSVDVWNRIAYNGLMSGYLSAVLFLLAHLSAPAEGTVRSSGNIMHLIGADLRPALYGLCIYTVFHHVRGSRSKREEPVSDGQTSEPTNDELYLFYQRAGLTNRETELAILAYRGYSNREIAEECYISEATVKKHMTHIFEKLGIDRREELQNRGAEIESSTDKTYKKTI